MKCQNNSRENFLFQIPSGSGVYIHSISIWTPIPWLCCPYAILPQLWKYAWGHCPFGRPICDQALTSWLMSWDVASIYPHNLASHDDIYFVKWTIPPAAKHPHNMMLPPPCFTVGVVFFGLQASSDQRTFLQKVLSLSPCAVAKRSLAFFMAVLEQWLLPCWAAFQVMSI